MIDSSSDPEILPERVNDWPDARESESQSQRPVKRTEVLNLIKGVLASSRVHVWDFHESRTHEGRTLITLLSC